MKKFKIHLTKNKRGAIFSKAIMWYDNSEFSHCAIEFRLDKLQEDVIYHSSLDSGVNFYSKLLFTEKNTIIHTYELEVEDHIYNIMMKHLVQSCGKKYAVFQNIGILFVDFAKKMGITIDNPWKFGYNCSELVYRHVILNNYSNIDWYDPETIKPSEVKDILDKLGV